MKTVLIRKRMMLDAVAVASMVVILLLCGNVAQLDFGRCPLAGIMNPVKPGLLPEGYENFVEEVNSRIRSAQVRAALSVNGELVLLYWNLGREILNRQKQKGWGAKIIDRLSVYLAKSFPGIRGFGARNLKYMRAFAEAYPDEEFVQQVVAQLPWGHQVRILDAVKDPSQRKWYIRQSFENGWSRNVLVHQIESRLFERHGSALTNFDRILPVFLCTQRKIRASTDALAGQTADCRLRLAESGITARPTSQG
ncbi:MAG: DUF1016 N-terminal domain-containing protein [Acidobacteriaceae bacterium]